MNVKEWLRRAEGRLSDAGVESARLEAQVLAAHVLLVDRSWLVAHEEAEFPDLAGENLLQRREQHEPLAYILGKREFYGREFVVRPGVLIPRHETEVLVETALSAIDAARPLNSSVQVLDVGVGSGAIAITLKLERPSTDMTGIDLQPDALEVAAVNAAALGADVRLVVSDGFEMLQGDRFDVIVSNPPYIGTGESLSEEVAAHEPFEALFSGPTGLEFYERLAIEAGNSMYPGGRLLLEVGHTQAAAVRALFESRCWVWRQTVRDLSGIERVVEFESRDGRYKTLSG